MGAMFAAIMGPSASDLQVLSSDPPGVAGLHFAPDRAVAHAPARRFAGRLAATGTLSAALHVGFLLGFVALVTWSERDLDPVHEIPVEVVAHMPGEGPTGEGPTGKPTSGSPVGHGPDASAPPATAPPDRPPPAGASEPRPPEKPAPAPAPVPAPAPAAAPAAGPPPLVAPPPEPMRAAAQPDKPVVPNTRPDKPTTDPVRAEKPTTETPRVLVTPDDHAFAVPAPAEPDAAREPKPAPPAPAPKDDPGATLAAALPTNLDALPATFRAALSAAGTHESPEYKGLVFGRLGRSREVIEKARARHLRGQAVVAFSIDDAGQIAQASILQSSGNPAVDEMALEMVRAAAPFPPPPPGAKRDFTPALSFGD